MLGLTILPSLGKFASLSDRVTALRDASHPTKTMQRLAGAGPPPWGG